MRYSLSIAGILLLALFPACLHGDVLPRTVIGRIPAPPVMPANISLLLVGDSLSISLGEQIEKLLARDSSAVTFRRLGKVSSGLARPDFFDWEQNLSELTARQKPNVVVIMLGTNDNKSLKRGNSTVAFGSAGWDEEYSTRMQRLLSICRRNNKDVKVFWVGAPIMADPSLARDLQRVNTVIEKWCTHNRDCHFISTWAELADPTGRFMAYLTDSNGGARVQLRAGDGIHLAPYGSQLLAQRTMKVIVGQLASAQRNK